MFKSITSVEVISKKGCHICEETIRTLDSLKALHKFELEVLDVDDDQVLFERYWIRVPVIRIEGKDIFEAKDLALGAEGRKRIEGLFKKDDLV